jgi:cellulose synthase/poly-beta-1,6-N-acetylglucosamine synthase-like glycosyltransferase
MASAVLIILLIYVLVHAILLYGVLRNRRKGMNKNYCPFVSLIICAKDEEEIIESCIKSVLNLKYPAEKLEVILVNDRSSDKTGEIMKSYTDEHAHLEYLEIRESTAGLKGKANALNQALKKARGEIIFTTDADINVNPLWIPEMLAYYDEGTGAVSSYSVIKPDGFFSSLQSVDWLYMLSVACGGDGIGIPISCVGNNMSYRKNAYDSVGGYERLKFSVTEDFRLLQAIHKKTSYTTRFPLNKNTVNVTLPCPDFKSLIRQKKRWASGGLGEFNLGIVIGALSWIAALIMLTGWLYLDLGDWLGFLIGKTIIDTIFLLPSVTEFKMYKVIPYMPLFQIYFSVYVLLTSVILAGGRTVLWKNQKI